MDAREDRWADAMRASLAGDGAAYQRLLGEIAAMLRGLVRARLVRLGLGPDDAEDVVQEILLALHRQCHTWDQDRPLMPWLNAITHYKLIDAARRLGRARRRTVDQPVEALADRLPAHPGPDMARAADRAADRAAADPVRAVAVLPGRERGVVSALGIEGLSVRSAAARFSISEIAVRVAFHRGLARLARLAETGVPQTSLPQPGLVRKGRPLPPSRR